MPTSPAILDNSPTPDAGRSNGLLRPSDLVEVTPTCYAARPAAASISALLADAHAHGVSLIASQCYRPIALQSQARTSACTSGNCACAGPPGHSNHGWAKAVDFRDANGPIITVTNPTHLWLKANAARFGWNHPRWAEPGGSPCPEPWHWEWVGDGGILHLSPVRADVVGLVPDGPSGYALCTALDEVIARGPATAIGSSPPQDVTRLVVGAAGASSARAILTVDADGVVRRFGEGTASVTTYTRTSVVGIAATPDGRGYFVLTPSGRVIASGSARNFGSVAVPSGSSVAGIAATADGNGYWIAFTNGRVVGLGDATPPATVAPSPPVHIVAITSRQSGRGYWMVTNAGRVIAGSGAPVLGSLTSVPRLPVVAIAPTRSGYGYWVATADGGVFAFGDARYFGTAAP